MHTKQARAGAGGVVETNFNAMEGDEFRGETDSIGVDLAFDVTQCRRGHFSSGGKPGIVYPKPDRAAKFVLRYPARPLQLRFCAALLGGAKNHCLN